jgi:hypothetical protein
VQIARHLEQVFAALPPGVTTIQARADSGFYCWEAVAAYEKRGVEFIISVRKTSRLMDELKAAEWRSSPRTDADGQCESRYQPEGWGKPAGSLPCYRKKPQPKEAGEARAIPSVRYARIQLSRVCDQHQAADRSAGMVLQPARQGREPDST